MSMPAEAVACSRENQRGWAFTEPLLRTSRGNKQKWLEQPYAKWRIHNEKGSKQVEPSSKSDLSGDYV
jgi:hypothetical protein